MNIIFFDWPCFCKNDVVETLESMGHTLSCFFHKDYTLRKSPDFDQSFDAFVSANTYDCLFSFNFFPLVAEGCKRCHLNYISVVYDAPHVALYSYTIVYPGNYVFIFDKTQYQELYRMGIRTVYHMPLAGNPHNIDRLLSLPHEQERFHADISFVGSLYNEDHNMFDRMSDLSDYSKGYLNAIMEAQLKVYGYYFIDEILEDTVLNDMKKALPYEAGHSGIQTEEYIYGDYVIGRKLTSLERVRILQSVASRHPVKLFTLNPNVSIPNVSNMGTVDYYTQMPYVFHYSKINLNITLRAIKSGVPLRAIDILSAGGFLMTNFQADFLDILEPDQDFVYFNDLQDLNDKIDYYLTHEEKRRQIAENGRKKILQYHNFTTRFQEIFQIVFPNQT